MNIGKNIYVLLYMFMLYVLYLIVICFLKKIVNYIFLLLNVKIFLR